MIRRRQTEPEVERGDGYYVSMTDMTIGVLFIFIIMLSYFALQYRRTTASLTRAKDPETAALLTLATALRDKDVRLGVDYEHRVVCIPTVALSADGQAGDTPNRCFAYSGIAPKNEKAHQAAEERASLVSFVTTDLSSAHVEATADPANGGIHFDADKLFQPGSAILSPNGETVARQLANSLATRLPCYGYGVPTTGSCDGVKMSVVNVVSQVSFNAFTDEGQKAAALALQRSVAFHRALTTDQPVLSQVRSLPAGQSGSQPLLRVFSSGQSEESAPAIGQGQSITLQFEPAR